MKNLMKTLRILPLQEIAGHKILRTEDYLKSEAFENGRSTPILLPKSDVIKLILDNGSSIAVRPSGTEPKCKFYINAVSTSKDDIDELPEKLYQDFAKALHL